MVKNLESLNLAVLEFKWLDDKNISLRGLFDLLSDIHCGHHHGYYYNMYSDHHSLINNMFLTAKWPKTEYVYIAGHGLEGEIVGMLDEDEDHSTTPEDFRKFFQVSRKVGLKDIQGLYFGCCQFGSKENAVNIFPRFDGLDWIAGYSEPLLGWIESSALDWVFWNQFMLNRNKQNPLQETVEYMKFAVPGLIYSLGFGVFVKRSDGKVLNLFESIMSAYDSGEE